MDQAEYKEILGMINSVTKFFDFRLVDEQGSHFNSLGVVLLGVHAGVDGLLDHCDLEVEEGGSWRKVWFVFFWIKHIFIFHLNAKHQAWNCMFQLQFCELHFLCWKCCYPTSSESLTGSCIPWLTLCCWVQVVVVMVEVELRAWLLEGFSMLYTWVAICLLKNLAFSGLNLDWLLCSSWWAPSPGYWLVWCSWGSDWGVGSVGLDWRRNRVCQNLVSQLVICHPSILVVY